jgi:hypothetical protein
MSNLKIVEERTLYNDSLDGYDLIKIFKKLPITIIKLKYTIVQGQINQSYSVVTDNRFKCVTNNSSELKVNDYDSYVFKLEHYVLKIEYHCWKKQSEIYTILLNDSENEFIRSMIEF